VTKLLLIEDEPGLVLTLTDRLRAEGYAVAHAADGDAGFEAAVAEPVDLVILDVGLPKRDGFAVVRDLRQRGVQTPVLMLTARGDEMDRIIGLEIGADDYLPKPYNPRELLARLRAILRRGRPGDVSPSLRFGRLEINEAAHAASLDGEMISLTSYQFELLCVLARHAGRVMSRDQLMDELQGHDLEAFDRSIDVHISRIRAQIEDDPKKPRRILTIRGTGYVFARQQD